MPRTASHKFVLCFVDGTSTTVWNIAFEHVSSKLCFASPLRRIAGTVIRGDDEENGAGWMFAVLVPASSSHFPECSMDSIASDVLSVRSGTDRDRATCGGRRPNSGRSNAMLPWLLGVLLLTRPSVAGNVSWVRGPEQYVALSGDLVVEYRLAQPSPAVTVQVVDARGTALAKTHVPRDSPSGRLVFSCGLVHKAGDYSFHLVNGDSTVAHSSRTTRVVWPASVAHVPLLLEAYGSDAVVAFEFPGVRCVPLQKDDFGFVASLLYEGSGPVSWLHEVVAQIQLPSWNALFARHVTFDCELFDRAGFYRVRLTCANGEELPVVSESVPVSVLWSSQYALDVAQGSVSACRDGISVIYRYPKMCSKGRDKVRLYGRPVDASRFRYLLERLLPKNRHVLTLGCHLFAEGFAEFCFVYVSVARNGAVFELRRVCRPWAVDPGGTSLSWGSWSEWTGCTGSCGVGMQIRYRLCGGRTVACPGSAYDVRNCTLDPCPEPSDPGTTEATASYCSCGCSLSVFRRETVQYRPPCTASVVTWVLRPLLQPRIALHLSDARLNSNRQQRVTVREGESPVGPLLAVIDPPDFQPLLVMSRSGPLRVDLLEGNGTTPLEEDYDSGLKMVFWGTGASPRRAALLQAGAPTPPVHVALAVVGGAVLCAILVLATLYTLHLQWRHRGRSESAHSLAENDVRAGLLSESVTFVSEVPIEVASKAVGQSPGDRVKRDALFKPITPLGELTPEASLGAGQWSGKSAVRRKIAPLAASSLSELSVSGTEDGFELDYYDYAWHDLPGSFFSGWPPFLPPPEEEDEALELQLQQYSLPPPETDLGD